jgi:hypothetical protein
VNDVGVMLSWGLAISLIGGVAFLTGRAIRAFRIRQALHAYLLEQRKIEPGLALFEEWNNRFLVEVIHGARLIAGKGVFTLSPQRFAVYLVNGKLEPVFSFSLDQLRWFGRPQKYHDGMNEMWLHIESGQGWLLVKLTLHRYTMQRFARELKLVTTPELVTAYRRRRPYIHAGPRPAQPATQDIHGAWTLGDPVSLYLMPLHLLILDGTQVLRVLALEGIQQIGALHRLDAPRADGLLRFRAEEADFAFALQDHETFAQSLAEAARRTLEAPLEQKQKGKDYDEAWEVEEE